MESIKKENNPRRILVMNPPSFDSHKYIKEGRCESKKGGQLTPPVTLGIISALLSKNQIENDFFDFMAEGTDENSFRKAISGRYNLCFFSVSAQTLKFDAEACSIYKEENPGGIAVAFGVLAAALPEKVLESGFDIAIIGEPEIAALEIVKAFAKTNDMKPGGLKSIKGICYREDGNKDLKNGKKGKLIRTGQRELLDDLDELPYPDRAKMPLSRYLNPRTGKPFTAIKVARGCPFSCSFCTAPFYYGKKPRYRSINNVLGEIEECVSKYNISDFLFLSDTFTASQKYVEKLCNEIIARGLNITWSCNSRVDTINLELAKLMRKAGCWLIGFGVESGSPKILKENSKGITPEKAILAAEIAREVGIASIMYYIFGFPGERKEEMKETIRLSLKVKSDFARFFVATPLPGSKLYDEASKESSLPDLGILDLSDADAALSEIKGKELKKMIRLAYLSFYLRPSQAFRVIRAYSLKNIFRLIETSVLHAKAYVFG